MAKDPLSIRFGRFSRILGLERADLENSSYSRYFWCLAWFCGHGNRYGFADSDGRPHELGRSDVWNNSRRLGSDSFVLFVPARIGLCDQESEEENLVVNLDRCFMLLPNAENAVIDIGKLLDYCLNPNHEVGKHKARVFASALGLTSRDATILREALLEAAKTQEAALGNLNEYGQRYLIDFQFEHAGKSAKLRGVWIIDTGSEIPRLISCLVL